MFIFTMYNLDGFWYYMTKYMAGAGYPIVLLSYNAARAIRPGCAG